MEFRSHTLANGLEIVAECNPDAHSSALGFFVRTGSRDETDAIAGVSHFLEHMMFKGTPTRSADDVNREFDEMGAQYNAFTNEETTAYYAAVLPECVDRAMGLLADILRPSLRVDDFEMEKQVILEEICMYEDQPPFLADEKIKAAYFGEHPLGRSVLGTVETVGGLTADAMRAYFEERYSPGNIVFSATGRVDFDAIVSAAERYCGHWPALATNRKLETATPHRAFRAFCKESASQQYVLAMAPGPASHDPDRYAAKILATVLGDDSGSRLFWELIDPGLAEQASMSHYEYADAGVLATFLCCDPELAVENLQRLLTVFRQIENDGVTPAELEQAKNKIRSRIVLSSEKPRGRLFVVASDWLYRQEYRSTAQDLEDVANLTVDDVSAVLAQYAPEPVATVAIGPLGPEEFESSAFGE